MNTVVCEHCVPCPPCADDAVNLSGLDLSAVPAHWLLPALGEASVVDSASSHHPSPLQLVTEKLVRRKSRSSQDFTRLSQDVTRLSQDVNLTLDELEYLRQLAPRWSESDAEMSAGEESDSANHNGFLQDLQSGSLVTLKPAPRPTSRQGQLPTIPHSPGPSSGLNGSSPSDYALNGPSVEETDGVAADNGSPDIALSSSEADDDEVWAEEQNANCQSMSGAVLPAKPLPSCHYRDWDGSFLPPSPEMTRRPNRISLGSDVSPSNMSRASSRSSLFVNQRLGVDSTTPRRPSTSQGRRASTSEAMSAEDTPQPARHERGSSVDSSSSPPSASLYPRDRKLSCSALGPLIRSLDLSSNCLGSVDGLCDSRVFRRLNALKDLDLKHNKLDCLNEDLFKVPKGAGLAAWGWGRVGKVCVSLRV